MGLSVHRLSLFCEYQKDKQESSVAALVLLLLSLKEK